MREQKHHYIPEFYLKQWAGPDGRLIEFCRRHFNQVIARPTFPGGTGYIRGLYSIPGTPLHIKDILEEKFLSIADGIAASSLSGMLKDQVVPTGPEKLGWTRFMMSLLYRTPEGVARAVEKVRVHSKNKALEDIRSEYEAIRKPDDPETAEDFMRLHGSLLTARLTVQHLIDIIESERVQEGFMSMRWFVGRVNRSRHEFLTSDRPFVMTNGIGHPDSHFCMPLSPKHIFVAARKEDEARKIMALLNTGELHFRMNDRIVRQARKFVFASNVSQIRFIQNLLGEKAVCSPFE